MKTPEEGYAKGWSDAIYAYESKKRKSMGTIDDLMALADQMRAYGEACAAAERDCRICGNFTTQSGGCISVTQCVDADCFKPTAPRRYWAIRARGET